jgi:hypothetical protein
MPKGLPEDSQLFSLAKYKGLNTKAKRPGIDDEEFSWVENLFPIGNSNLRTLYGPGAAIYTATGGKTIKYIFMFNIATTQYAFVLLSDGSGNAVNLATNAVAQFAPPGSYTTVACVQWGNQYLIIVDANNPYSIWDGTTWYTYGSTLPGPDGGALPSGLVGTYVEIFQSRVWIVNGAVCTYSAPSSLVNFSTSAGGGSFTSTDSFLRTAFYGIKQASGFLYTFGDSSINIISNVQTTTPSGGSPTTTFNNSNSDPQTGTSWPNTLQAFGRALVFANSSGVFALYGSSAEKVSDALDGVFAQADFTTLVPSAGVVTLYGIKCYAIQILTYDPSGIKRPIMFLWDGKKWFAGSQNDNSMLLIAGQQAVSINNLWATDGTKVFQCFSTSSNTLTKQFSGKLWSATDFIFTKKALRAGIFTSDNMATIYTYTLSVDNEYGSVVSNLSGNAGFLWTNSSGAAFSWTNGVGSAFTWVTTGFAFSAADIVNAGRYLGLSFTTTANDITVIAATLGYEEVTAW